jgi:signal transduction histidine kinase
LSRELHDGVGHHLVALSVNLDLARHQCTNAEARATVSIARELAQRALSESRTVVDVLRASDPFDLEGALQALAYETVTPRIEVDTALASPLTSDVAHAVLRCAQEGVTNALKHAHASRIRITVEEIDAEVRVRIEDDGIGRLPLTEGNGIRGLRERATLLHGRLSIAARTPGLCLMLCLPRNSVAS